MTCQIDSHEPFKTSPRGSQHGMRELQYQTIGKTLLIAEAATHRIGVPWLPPTAEVRARAAAFESPLDEFIRYSLVTVGTKTLETYCYDLESGPLTAEHATGLCIPQPSTVERFALAGLVAGILFAADLLICRHLGLPYAIAAVSATLVGIFGGITCSALCLEQNRRKTFHFILTQELLRRSGDDQPNAPKVPLVASTETPTE